ncbi:NAD-dependent epimerase/dehydratase family protein [Microbacterium sp. PRC9]|uniref:NAD-dependent epimerase/dehydratase family protein n=1 Tax=Microbacterium sp. PRC9 TaxID=2962591 RepID=UPI002881F2FF|nr:NAD-dependent epimerase/dehydratase family protein [Microbacterium sp. PRC9]MDT0141477.1 NAD-dependent epimerase/dehydratase family protein [Microbacterium sp. PRC9]
MRVLITGAAGFIGSNLTNFINQQEPEWQVRGLDDLSNGDLDNLRGLDAEMIVGSLLDEDALARAVRGVDAVVHLGALGSVPRSIGNPLATHHANATGTLMLLEAARHAGVAHVIAASSSSVYGTNSASPKNEAHWTNPVSPYAVSKLATEGYTVAYALSYGMRTLALRFFNVYGRRQSIGHAYAAVIPQFIGRVRAGNPLLVYGDGQQSRDFTHVDSVCSVLLSALRRRTTDTRPVNVAFGSSTTINELISVLEDAAGRRFDREHLPDRTGDVRASKADAVRLRELFPEIEPVPLRDGVLDTWRWFEAQDPNRVG